MGIEIMTTIRRALRVHWLPLAYIVMFAWLDWLLHRDIALIILIGTVAIIVTFGWPTIAWRLRIPEHHITRRSRGVLPALPPLAYFVIRGRGTSGATGIIASLAMLGVVAILFEFWGHFDTLLTPVYTLRNQFVPRQLRNVLALLLPIILSFLVIHGSLSDLPALIGGRTRAPQSGYDLGLRLFIGMCVSFASAFLLLRRPDG